MSTFSIWECDDGGVDQAHAVSIESGCPSLREVMELLCDVRVFQRSNPSRYFLHWLVSFFSLQAAQLRRRLTLSAELVDGIKRDDRFTGI